MGSDEKYKSNFVFRFYSSYTFYWKNEAKERTFFVSKPPASICNPRAVNLDSTLMRLL